MPEASFLNLSHRDVGDGAVSVWPAWEVREHGGAATRWFHVRLAFADGARVDALAVVDGEHVSVEDVTAQPAFSLADLTVLADWIDGPLSEACGVAATGSRAGGAARAGEEGHGGCRAEGAGLGRRAEEAGGDRRAEEAGGAAADVDRPAEVIGEEPDPGDSPAEVIGGEPDSGDSPAEVIGGEPGAGDCPAEVIGGEPGAGDWPAEGIGIEPGAGDRRTEAVVVERFAGDRRTEADGGVAGVGDGPNPRRARPVWPRGIAGRRLVAQEYRAARDTGADPVLAVMNATGHSRRRSLRLIAQARDAGLLAPRHARR
ncbi:hypothetical protein GCM10010521_49390 [Streptomyces rameus]|uniref:Uncharacterized protein n=1 Tax=Streptomyces rameus TaxID=68261 RepID=A0ABP6NQJ9_9ACTN